VSSHPSDERREETLNALVLAYAPSPGDLIRAVVDRSPSHTSPLHGEEHWRSVGNVGMEVGAATPGADLGLVFLFSLLHDAVRWSDLGDSGHGRRSSELVRELNGEGLLDLPEEAKRLLASACLLHSEGARSSDPTIGTCWDADRLNLWRIGSRPDPALLSTAEARRPERVNWALDALRAVPTWPQLLSRRTASLDGARLTDPQRV
jgi:uncharacterized protein